MTTLASGFGMLTVALAAGATAPASRAAAPRSRSSAGKRSAWW